MLLDKRFMSYTVVSRNADGGLDSACVQGEEAATKLLQGPIARTQTAGGKHEN